MLQRKNKKIKIFQAFAGIGSQYRALQNVGKQKGWDIESVGIIEWYVDAIIGYQAIHDFPKDIYKDSFDAKENTLSANSKIPWSKKGVLKSELAFWINRSQSKFNNMFDIKSVKGESIPKDIDIFTYSFPSQDLSNQGLKKGIDKRSNNRSGILWQIERIFKEMSISMQPTEMPKYLLMENVYGLKDKSNEKNYQKWISFLNKLGYVSHEYVVNAKDFGLPQNRKRIFLLSIRKDLKKDWNFKFKELETSESKPILKDVLRNNQQNIKYITGYELTEFRKRGPSYVADLENFSSFVSERVVFDSNAVGPTLTASGALSRIKVHDNGDIRILSPLEATLYMGFTEKDYDNLVNSDFLSDNKIVFLMGNSIPINSLEAILKTLEFN